MQYSATNLIFFKIIHYIVLFYSILKDVIMPVSTVINVTHLAPSILRTTQVTYRVECVPRVKLGGLEFIIKKSEMTHRSL